jgi:hypothetical protein
VLRSRAPHRAKPQNNDVVSHSAQFLQQRVKA